MSKKSNKLDDKQITIYEYLKQISEEKNPPSNAGGQFKVIDHLRASMRTAIKDCSLSIHQIAGEMGHLLDTTITKEIIYSWTRESDELNGRPGRHIPAEYLPAFCQVTGCNDPLVILGKIAGLFVLPGPEALRAEIQKLDEMIKSSQAKKKKRLMFLREMEK